LKIKLDENIPGAVAGVLRSRGHDVDTVLEESLGGRDDPTVLGAAIDEGRLLLTLDRGFGDVRAYAPGTHPGIIVLRPDDQRVPTVVAMVEMIVDHHDVDELAGCITVVQRNVLRVRRPNAR
jgi:predicted nuclease of predicted toxin-antitoxin system